MQQIERKQSNLLNAIMECEDDAARKIMYAELPKLEASKKQIEQELSFEEKSMIHLTKEQIAFFLSTLKNGDIDDTIFRKTLITIFVNKIYLYDDKLIFFFNATGKPTEIKNDLLNEVESINLSECSNIDQFGQPIRKAL